MNQSLPLLFGLLTTPLELISFILSIVTVALNIRQLHWAWLFSILSSGLYAVVFLDARLYGEHGIPAHRADLRQTQAGPEPRARHRC